MDYIPAVDVESSIVIDSPFECHISRTLYALSEVVEAMAYVFELFAFLIIVLVSLPY